MRSRHDNSTGNRRARSLLPKHAVKQVDRLLSNPRIEAWDVFASWVPEMVGPRTDIVVAMDWTDFDADGHGAQAGDPPWPGNAAEQRR